MVRMFVVQTLDLPNKVHNGLRGSRKRVLSDDNRIHDSEQRCIVEHEHVEVPVPFNAREISISRVARR